MKGKLVLVVLAVILYIAFIGSSVFAEESISAYMGYAREINEGIAQNVKEKTGIEIKNLTLSFGEVWARIQAEKPNFHADMAIAFGMADGLKGKKERIFECYQSPAWSDISPPFRDADGCWYPTGNWSFVLIGNKNKLAEKGWKMPNSWKNLLDPKWKEQIVAPSPVTSGTAFMMLYSFLQLYGEKEGWKFLEALDKNMAQYTKSGNAPTDLVSRGEYLIGITSDEHVLKRIQDGYPLQWAVPVEGIGYESGCIVILKGTKKLVACKKVIDYLGTVEFSKFMGKFGSSAPRIEYTGGLYGATKPKYIKLDHAWVGENKDRILDQWKSKFIKK